MNNKITYYENGSKYSEYFHLDLEKSCKITYYENGYYKKKTYFLNEMCHNSNGPAIVKFYPNKNIKTEIYLLDGFIQRENNKPSFISYYPNGQIKYKKWYEFMNNISVLNNHKPAVIKYYENGNVQYKKYIM